MPMNALHNLKIGTRLGLGSALVLLLTAAIVALAQSSVSRLHNEIENLADVEWEKAKLGTLALDNARGSIARLFQAAVDTDKANVAKARERFTANTKAVNDALAKLVPMLHLEENK